jgi:hypothetical protein
MILNISGIECFEKDGTAYLKLETVARGLGFTKTEIKNGVEYNFGYADRQEITLTPGTPLGDSPDQKQLEERIAESVIEE